MPLSGHAVHRKPGMWSNGGVGGIWMPVEAEMRGALSILLMVGEWWLFMLCANSRWKTYLLVARGLLHL
jgi:hypothetical protein